MSKYTTQLRYVVYQSLDNLGASHNEENWHLIYDKIGLSDYPIFNENHREVLNNKIIRHYISREIGAETVGKFKEFVRDTMFLIMPYFNQLYESEILAQRELEPLGDHNLTKTEHAWGTASNSGSNESDGSTDSQNVYQDTPTSELIPDQVRNLKYATDVNIDTGKTHAQGSSESSGEYDNMIERKESGYSRPQAELLQLYRDTFLNIDKQVVEHIELRQCFLTIW